MAVTVEQLETTVATIRVKLTDALVSRMRLGERVTYQYRQFCDDSGFSLEQGMQHPHRPWPFPLDKPMVCFNCGRVEREDVLHSPENYRKLLSGGYGPDAEPDLYELACPECGETESYNPQAVCEVCWDYPCTCTIGDMEP
ncbi:MAG TPA: hypothetical protein VMY35_17435 [Phycisphaerae bacterium]|nr:hypothetical protein [Phycisphaerae bacterium]